MPEVDIYLREDDILVLDYQEPVKIGLDLFQKVEDGIYSVAGNKAYPTLVYACPGLNADKAVKKISASEEGNIHNVATAIVCDTFSHRILGNLFIWFQRPVRPTRMFPTEEAALNWLRRYQTWHILT